MNSEYMYIYSLLSHTYIHIFTIHMYSLFIYSKYILQIFHLSVEASKKFGDYCCRPSPHLLMSPAELFMSEFWNDISGLEMNFLVFWNS